MPTLCRVRVRPPQAARGHRRLAGLAFMLLVLAGCSTATPTPASTASASPLASSSPSPTPIPTPRFANQPDPTLAALVPATVAGHPVTKPSASEFAVAPGDFGSAFGALASQFVSLVIAYVEKPRLSLYAARLDGPPATTAGLKPSLATAAEYVGIAGIHPEAWRPAVVAGHQVWTRAGDGATLPGTTLYCWSSGPYVFLLIGADDAQNRAMVSDLPGEPAPTPPPVPSSAPSGSPSLTVPASPSSSPAPS